MGENRLDRRYNNHLNPVTCTKNKQEDVNIDVFDLSVSGIGVNTNEKLSSGDKIELELIVQNDDIPIFVKGEVVWAEKNDSKDGLFQAGIRMETINSLDRDRLTKHINSHHIRFK